MASLLCTLLLHFKWNCNKTTQCIQISQKYIAYLICVCHCALVEVVVVILVVVVVVVIEVVLVASTSCSVKLRREYVPRPQNHSRYCRRHYRVIITRGHYIKTISTNIHQIISLV